MNRSDRFETIRLIADEVCFNSASQDQVTQLQELLRGDSAAQEFFYDYLSMHVHLTSSLDEEMELVYRRMTMTAEEFVLRTKSGNEKAILSNADNIEPVLPQPQKRLLNLKSLIIIVLLVSCLVLLFINRTASPYVAEVTQGKVTINGLQGNHEGGKLSAGIYETQNGATIQLLDGNSIKLGPSSSIKIFNNKEIRVRRGQITVEPSVGHSTIIHHQDFLAHSKGGSFSIELSKEMRSITSGERALFVPLRWSPNHFWSFDGNGDRIVDSAGSAHGVPSDNVTKVSGLVGQGVSFNYLENGTIDVGSGGGTVPGTGSFAVVDGITIEALIQPNSQLEVPQESSIFYQQHLDGSDQIALGIQQHATSPSINFGLFLLGQGYHELSMPLDGEKGRPSLADLNNGSFYHLAATYNVKTGLKAIYVNGKQLAAYEYPPGSKVVSGGAASTVIGKAFSGVIDEVAFYDFALPQYTLQMHFENALQGRNFFGFAASAKPLPKRIRFSLPANKKVELDRENSLPSKLVD